jgi:hypothetical protein
MTLVAKLIFKLEVIAIEHATHLFPYLNDNDRQTNLNVNGRKSDINKTNKITFLVKMYSKKNKEKQLWFPY